MYNGTLFILKKEWNSDIYYSMDDSFFFFQRFVFITESHRLIVRKQRTSGAKYYSSDALAVIWLVKQVVLTCVPLFM